MIEGHLGLATSIVIELCPRRCRDLFPDLVQEANLVLIQATNRCDYTKSSNFTAYVAAWMRGKVKQALSDDSLISRALVYTTAHDAMQRLRALTSGQATLSQRNGKPCISLPERRLPQLSPEREATLLHAKERIETEGRTVTIRLLVQETGLPKHVGAVFLQKLRGKTATSAQVERQARLEAAYRRLEAAGRPYSGRALAREAQVALSTAQRFLRKPGGSSA